MVQLSILSGKMAGDVQVVRRFPFSIGRLAENNLCLDESGIWDKHLTFRFQKKEGFTLETTTDALATVNGQAQKTVRLRNGDIISFGSAKIQFWLAPAQLCGLHVREAFIWMLLVVVTAIQIAVIYHLVH